jgi:hypothetical protein
MVANANPVFLRLDDQEVLGKPKPALGTSSQSRNLVANSAMIDIKPAKQKAAPASQAEPKLLPEVAAVSSIPVSPTR